MRDDDRRRDALVEAILPDVPFDGWSHATILGAAQRIGMDASEIALLLPRGPRDAVAAFSRWADRKMLAALDQAPLEAMKVRERVATAVLARLAALTPHREAVRRALALLALPQNIPLGARLLYETVDTIWYVAGDTATDFNFYTKRGLLAGVLAATTLYWLDDRSAGAEATNGFLERRLSDVMRIPRIAARLRQAADELPNPFRFARVARRH